MKRVGLRIDATELAQAEQAAAEVGLDRAASGADLFGLDGSAAGAAVQRVAVEIDAHPVAGLERRTIQRVRQSGGVPANGREVVRQGLRAAQQECRDRGGAPAPRPDNSAR
jgi:hypothetical protein